jgi:hypothetical protein
MAILKPGEEISTIVMVAVGTGLLAAVSVIGGRALRRRCHPVAACVESPVPQPSGNPVPKPSPEPSLAHVPKSVRLPAPVRLEEDGVEDASSIYSRSSSLDRLSGIHSASSLVSLR